MCDSATTCVWPKMRGNRLSPALSIRFLIFSVSHRLSSIRNVDKIVVLVEGKIVEQGTQFWSSKISVSPKKMNTEEFDTAPRSFLIKIFFNYYYIFVYCKNWHNMLIQLQLQSSAVGSSILGYSKFSILQLQNYNLQLLIIGGEMSICVFKILSAEQDPNFPPFNSLCFSQAVSPLMRGLLLCCWWCKKCLTTTFLCFFVNFLQIEIFPGSHKDLMAQKGLYYEMNQLEM